MLASGGSDSIINVWLDCTKDDDDDAIRKEVKFIRNDVSQQYFMLCFVFFFFQNQFQTVLNNFLYECHQTRLKINSAMVLISLHGTPRK